MLRCQLMMAAQILLVITFAEAHNLKCQIIPSFPSPTQSTGLLTDRLSSKELEKWKIIERIVFAEDANFQPLHPTLVNLWEWVATSGHVVYVEFASPGNASSCMAGHFVIERFDPLGEKHVAVIRLNLSNINQAYIGPDTRRPNGFIPFLGLDREERYAEVLGHELAHAVHILTSMERTHMVEEVVQKTNQMLLSEHSRTKGEGLRPELQHRLSKRDALLQKLEDQAEAMEVVVWRELAARKPERELSPNLATKK